MNTHKMLSLSAYDTLPLNQEIFLYTCSQCTYYPEKNVEINFDIMWHSNTRTTVLEYEGTFYILPLPSHYTLRQVLYFLQLEHTLIHLGWCYHLQSNDIDVILSREVESLAIHHLNIYGNNSVLEWWENEYGCVNEPGSTTTDNL